MGAGRWRKRWFKSGVPPRAFCLGAFGVDGMTRYSGLGVLLFCCDEEMRLAVRFKEKTGFRLSPE